MREIASHESDDVYARLWKLDTEETVLFVTHLTPESATRYQFDVTDQQTQQCVYTKGDGTTPPRIVVELLNEGGYTVTNLPNIMEDSPGRKAKQVSEAIQWLSKHGGFEPGDIRQFAYQRANNVMPTIYSSEILLEVIGPDRFTTHLTDVLNDAARSGVSITPAELLEPRTHTIEFLQTTLIEMRRSLPLEDQERVSEIAEERYGMTPSAKTEKQSEQSWSQTTSAESKFQLNPDAVATLKEEGWFPNNE